MDAYGHQRVELIAGNWGHGLIEAQSERQKRGRRQEAPRRK